MLLPAVSLSSFSNQVREVSEPGVVFLVLKAMQAIKTGLVRRQLSPGSAVSLYCSGTAAWERGQHRNQDFFFVLLGFFSGSFCKGLLGTAARVKWSNQNGSWLAASLADGHTGAAGGAVCAGARLSRAGAPCGTAKCPKCRGHSRV